MDSFLNSKTAVWKAVHSRDMLRDLNPGENIMFELLLYLVSLALIWGAWGFWAMLATFGGGLLLAFLFNPRNSYDVPWGSFVSRVLTIIGGVIAVINIWREPAYTAAAIVVVVVLLAIDWKS